MPQLTLSQLACSRCIWSAVGAIVLKVVVVLMLANFSPTVDYAPSVAQAHLGAGGSPLEEASRHAQDLCEQCAQQSFGFSLPLIVDPFLSPRQHNPFLSWSPVNWVLLFIVPFFPRRFLRIRPSADDDSFLDCPSL